MSERDRLSDFLYHLGKGLWKSVPILGPIVEEIFYEQFRDELKERISKLSKEEVKSLIDAIPNIDIKQLEYHLGEMSENIKKFSMHQTTALLANLEEDYSQLITEVKQIQKSVEFLPNICEILVELREKVDDRKALQLALENLSAKREAWIRRLSDNQRKLLERIPDEYTDLSKLWDITRVTIPRCGYKQYRFRLHEFEWLGLVERYWCGKSQMWMYRRSKSGKEVVNARD